MKIVINVFFISENVRDHCLPLDTTESDGVAFLRLRDWGCAGRIRSRVIWRIRGR